MVIRERSKNLIMAVLSTVLALSGLAFASVSSFYSGRTMETAHAQYTAAKCQESEKGCANALFNLGDTQYDSIRNTFLSIWTQNFLGTMQLIPTCVNDEATGYATFPATLEGSSATDEIAYGTSFYFSNQQKQMRFETLCINVYQKRWEYSSIKALGKDGFVLLPDYYADLLINRSSDMSSYDDLLPVYSSSGTPLSCKSLILPFGEQTRSWAIVGIYHAKGINESYYGQSFAYNDKDYGELANSFNSPLLIGFDYDFLVKNLNGFFLTSKAQTYTIKNNVDILASCDEKGSGCARFFTAGDEKMTEVPSSYEIYQQCLLKQRGPKWQGYLFIVLSLICIAAASMLSAKIAYTSVSNAVLWIFLPIVFVGVVSGILRGLLANRFAIVGTLISSYLGSALLIALAANAFALWAHYKKREWHKNGRQ